MGDFCSFVFVFVFYLFYMFCEKCIKNGDSNLAAVHYILLHKYLFWLNLTSCTLQGYSRHVLFCCEVTLKDACVAPYVRKCPLHCSLWLWGQTCASNTPVRTHAPLWSCIKQSITICVDRLALLFCAQRLSSLERFDFYGLPLAEANTLKVLFKFHS